MKEQIMKLRTQGLSYRQIKKELGCSTALIAYYLTPGEKDKIKARRKLYRAKENEKAKQRSTRNKQFTWRLRRRYGCKNCGIKDPRVLQFDHLDSTTKKANISVLASYSSMTTLKNEIRKCQILCGNCHLIKTFEERNCQSYD